MKIDKYSAILGNAVGYPDMASLTDNRPLASLPFDGKYRLIDFQLSSLANAGIRSVYGIFRGQNIRSIFDHVRSGREWGLNTLLSHYFLGFYQSDMESQTADADYYEQVLTYLKRSGSNQTIYMSCDMLCNIDLEQVIHLHTGNQRKITVVYKKMPAESRTAANAILTIDETDTVVGLENHDPAQASQSMSADIYVVDTPWLIEQMEVEAQKENPRKLRFLLRELLVAGGALAFEYPGYLANISSVQSYYQANMDMLNTKHFYNLFYANQKIYTKVKNEEATYFAEGSSVTNSQFASGSVIKGEIDHSIISRNCRVEAGARVAHSVIFPKVKVGEGAVIEYAIIDKQIDIPAGTVIKGTPDNPKVIGKGVEIVGETI